jgi:ribulose-bisphosphate carboxylase large chain
MLDAYDIAPFFSEWEQLPQDDYLRFHYRCVPAIDPRRAAAGLCAESSTAMWQRNGIAEDLREQFGAKVVHLAPCVGDAHLWELTIAHPHRNFGPLLPNLLVAAAGEGTFYAPGISTIQLVDISFSPSYLQHFAGPQFGLAGLREQLQIVDRPFFIGVVKPNLGLAPGDFATLAGEAWLGGLDIAKDDEMQANPAWSPLAERVTAVTRVRQAAQDATGVPKGYIANVTDEVAQMPERCRTAESNGATMIMCNPIWTGFSSLRMLRNMATTPIMGHFAGAAVLSRQEHFGIASPLLSTLMRLAGADLIAIAGFGERMATTHDEVRANIAACLEPLGSIAPALPIPGGSSTAESLAALVEAVGHVDFGFIAGRGIFGHAEGPRAGATAVRTAWEQIAAVR